MSFLKGLLPLILDWLWSHIGPYIVEFFKKKDIVDEVKEKQRAQDRQAKIVNDLRLEILKLRSDGQLVPPEMEKKLYEETRKLINM